MSQLIVPQQKVVPNKPELGVCPIVSGPGPGGAVIVYCFGAGCRLWDGSLEDCGLKFTYALAAQDEKMNIRQVANLEKLESFKADLLKRSTS